MSLQNLETGQPAPAREQIQELTQQSRQEYENSLLKQALQEYNEQWTALKGEQNSFIRNQTRQNQHERAVSEKHRKRAK